MSARRAARVAVLLLAVAGCGTIREFRYVSTEQVAPRLPGTPRVNVRPVPDLNRALFPGLKEYHLPDLTRNLLRAVEADFGTNVFTGTGPDVRVVVEIRKLTVACAAGGVAEADLTVELKAADAMLGRFDATGRDAAPCGDSKTDTPPSAVAAVQRALEAVKAQLTESRGKIMGRLGVIPGFASNGSATGIARPAGGDKINVAVAELEAHEVSGSTAVVIADWLRGSLVSSGSCNVVERGAMQRVLAEQAFQQSGCTNQDCAVKLGRVLNVQRMVVGSVGKLLASYVVNVRVVDVETGQVVVSDTARGKNEDEIEASVKEMAGRLTR